MTPEKKLLYEVFDLLETHIYYSSRIDFDIRYVKSIEKKITVLLKREVLDRSMKESPTTSANNILASISMLYEDTIDKEVGVTVEEELDDGERDDINGSKDIDIQTGQVDVPNSRTGQKKKGERIKKVEMHKHIGEDLWALGKEEFAKVDAISERVDAVYKRIKKVSLRGCIIQTIHDDKANSSVTIPNDIEYMSSLQRYVRGRANNLDLTLN